MGHGEDAGGRNGDATNPPDLTARTPAYIVP